MGMHATTWRRASRAFDPGPRIPYPAPMLQPVGASSVRRVLLRVKTPFNHASVVARGRSRHLEVEGATYASYHPERRFWGYAWDALAASVLHHPAAAHGGKDLRVLLIGLGGGTALHALNVLVPQARLTTAEIDPVLVDITRDHFCLENTAADVVVGDGYAHVDASPGTYDVILDDAFLAHGDAARTQDVSRALIARLRAGLRPGGMVVCNVFSDAGSRAALTRAREQFSQAFPVSFELAPPLGHNAILCGLPQARNADEVAAHVATLPPRHKRAVGRIKEVWRLARSQRRAAADRA